MDNSNSITPGTVIGMAGAARSGKDTAGFYLQEVLYEQKSRISKRCGFADLLKEDLEKLCRTQFGFSAFTDDPHQKETIRPLLVAYGTHVWRKKDINHWINKMKPTVDFFTAAQRDVIITDVRYDNEADWIQNELGGTLIYIERDGTLPANTEEEENCPLLKNRADKIISWGTYGKDIEKAKTKVLEAASGLNFQTLEAQPA